MKGIIIAEGLRYPDAGTRPWIENMMTTLLGFAEDRLKATGRFLMQVHGFDDRGQEYIIPLQSTGEADRQMGLRAVKFFFKEHHIVRYFILSEAWGVRYDTTDPKQQAEARSRIEHGGGGSLEHHPQRMEVLMINYISSGFQRGELWEMLRDKEGNFTGLSLHENIAEDVKDYDKRTLRGRMNDLLPRRPETE